MHLIHENVVKNLLSLYTSDYKGLDTGSEDYELEPDAVEAIGSACVAAGNTTPSAFGARVPNLATQRHYYTAESYTLFSTLLAPVVLRNRFSNAKYYKHFVELVAIFNGCLRMSIGREYVDVVLRRQIVDWVQKFEKYFYQYKPHRLSTCVLTIHALLHIPDNILNAGPMCMIKLRFGLRHELDLSDRREEDCAGHTVNHYPGICVLRPHLRAAVIKPAVRKAIERYLLLSFEVDAAQAATIIPEELSHWGKISFLNGGDKMRGTELFRYSEKNATQDASFVKVREFSLGPEQKLMYLQYSHEVDKNARYRNRPVQLERRVAYAQLLRVVEFRAELLVVTNDNGRITQQPKTLLLAVVRPVKIAQKSVRLGTPYYQDGQFAPVEVIDVDDLSCLVARIPDPERGPKKWALCERSDAMGVSEQALE
uniref:Uncharacterized protein n=1 Tax=Mycena chlorophos TaxID=658473 RepID=A0ABQ0LE28_MYCCL|nr:predicted protein [Mycena chlorophos]